MTSLHCHSSKEFKYIELFAGIGGFRIALDSLGGSCVFASEIDDACRDMYENHFGERPHGDITKINEQDIPDHDILTAGFPCQAFSIIGDRKGFDDTRGTLFFDIERILYSKRPPAFILENVKNLFSHDGGRTYAVIHERLTALGYHLHATVLNGLDFGLPQKRERAIIVGFIENVPFKFPDKIESYLSLDELLEDEECVDPSLHLSPGMRAKFERRLIEQGKSRPRHATIWHENKSGNIGIHPYSCALRAGGSYNYLTVSGYRRLSGREMLRLQGFPDDYEIVVPYSRVRSQAGNSIVIPKIRAVGVQVLAALQDDPKPPVHAEVLF